MRKTLLYIGGGALQIPGIRWAREAGLEVVLTDANATAPGRVEADGFVQLSGTDVDGLVGLARALAVDRDFVGAYCSNDFGLEAIAAISQATGTPGNPVAVVRTALDKHAAKDAWRARDVATPEGAVVASETELRAALDEFGLPAIVKPLDSSGSRGVRSVWSASEMASAYDEARAHARADSPILVERYVGGAHVDVNALLAGGAFVRCGLLDRYFTEPPQHVPTWGCQPSRHDAATCDAIYDLVERAARALGIEHGPVKADVVVPDTTSDAGPVILELATRFHGDVSTAHVTPLCDGASPIQAWFRYLADPAAFAADETTARATSSAGWMALFPDRPGTFERIAGLDAVEGLAGSLLVKPPGHRIDALGDNTSMCALLFVAGSDAEDVRSKLDAARAVVDVVVR